MGKRGPAPSGKVTSALALHIDASVMDRLHGCAVLMRGEKWTRTYIVERALREFFARIESAAGVSIPTKEEASQFKPEPKKPKVLQDPPHPLMRKPLAQTIGS